MRTLLISFSKDPADVCYMVNFCLHIIFFSLNHLISSFIHQLADPSPPFLITHAIKNSYFTLHPSIFILLILTISVSSRSVRRRFRSQTPHELWPPCWDINRRNCGGTLRLPGEGSWKWGKGRDSTVTRSCSHEYNVHALCTCTDRRSPNNGGEQFSL